MVRRTRTTLTQSIGTRNEDDESYIFSHNHLKNLSSRVPAATRCSWTWCYELDAVATVNMYWECVSMTFARARALNMRAQSILLGIWHRSTGILTHHFSLTASNSSESIHRNDKIPKKIDETDMWYEQWTCFWFIASISSAFHFHFVDKMELI